MKNIIVLSILVSLISCSSKEDPYDKLQGFWWNGYGAIYINDSICLVQEDDIIVNFEIISENKLLFSQNNKTLNTQEFRFNNDTLEIADTLREPTNDISYRYSRYRYKKIQPVNADTFKQIFLSYSGDFSSFNLYIDNQYHYLLEVYKRQFKERKYKGTVSKELISYLNAAVNRIELLDTNYFSHNMYACFPYWAAFVYTTDGKKYNLQNNYDNKGSQKILANVLIDFPYLLDLEEGEFGDDEFKAIKEFYFSEDKRSWEVHKQRVQEFLKEN